jgi:CheY-like chemotaxis protein
VKRIETLYLVDDDDTYQFLASEIIKSTNLVNQIEIFSNGAEAINYLKSVQNPDLLPEVIFLDIFMPVMDGWGFLDEFVRLSPDLKKKILIYIISSSIDPTDVERASSISDVTGYIVKPITRDKFMNMIKELV